jgi:hypothetical protein
MTEPLALAAPTRFDSTKVQLPVSRCPRILPPWFGRSSSSSLPGVALAPIGDLDTLTTILLVVLAAAMGWFLWRRSE